jgi:hypothetical protein
MLQHPCPLTCESCKHASYYPTVFASREEPGESAFYLCNKGFGSITEDGLAEAIARNTWACWGWEMEDETID